MVSEFTNLSDKLRIGIPDIDAGHERLAELLDGIHNAMRTSVTGQEMAQALDPFLACVRQHFKVEEQFMEEHGVPDFAHHKTLHTNFLEQLEGLRTKIARGTPVITYEISKFLRELFVRHITTQDRKMAEFVQYSSSSATDDT